MLSRTVRGPHDAGLRLAAVFHRFPVDVLEAKGRWNVGT